MDNATQTAIQVRANVAINKFLKELPVKWHDILPHHDVGVLTSLLFKNNITMIRHHVPSKVGLLAVFSLDEILTNDSFLNESTEMILAEYRACMDIAPPDYSGIKVKKGHVAVTSEQVLAAYINSFFTGLVVGAHPRLEYGAFDQLLDELNDFEFIQEN